MRDLFLIASSIAVVFAAVSASRMLCLDQSSIYWHSPSDKLFLSANWCDDRTKVLLGSDGSIHVKDTLGKGKVFSLRTGPLFRSELSALSMMTFLKPFYEQISWTNFIVSSKLLDWVNVSHLPRSFWRSIKPTQIPPFISRLSTEEILEFLEMFKEENIPLDQFVIYSGVPGKCAGAAAGTILKKGQPLIVVEAMKMINTISAKHSWNLVAKLYTDGDVIQSNQPLYLSITVDDSI